MQNIDSSNILFSLALELVNHTSRHIFLTGKAGTGKTTFLKFIRSHSPKQMAIVAPTGVAAINAGGVTIHSFFQLPFSPFIPGNGSAGSSHTVLSRLRINSQKRQIIQELELLVIDEISMVRCDTLDAIDLVLRHIRKRPYERFGGVQVLFIGDMFQLPPVAKDQEWNLLSAFYESPYFFDSHVLRDEPPVCIEFEKIYRQTEEKFIRVLNQVRNNELDEEGLELLKQRYQPSYRAAKNDGYIILTTHNEKARSTNAQMLQSLNAPLFSYEAEIENEFSENAYPADLNLQLKIGAQVMFIRNDTERRFFNGKIGIVTALEKNKIFVHCKDEEEPIEVGKEKWENIRYSLNRQNRQLEEEVLGSFTQYPLRLAWAITIHKSQGLTFEKAIIDAGKAFAPGQVYVALSRCTSLEGMVLHSEIDSRRLLNDERIIRFAKRTSDKEALNRELEVAGKHYRQRILSGLFDFNKPFAICEEISGFLAEQITGFNEEAVSWSEQISSALSRLQTTAAKFQSQLRQYFNESKEEFSPVALQERIKAACGYFIKEIGHLVHTLKETPVVTDSKMQAKEFNDMLRNLFGVLSMQQFLMEGIADQFDPVIYHQRRKEFKVPSFSVNVYAGVKTVNKAMANAPLYQQLKQLRDQICSQKNLPVFMVAGSQSLEELATYLPVDKTSLRQISGFGSSRVESYGERFLELIRKYCDQHGLESNMADLTPKRIRKPAATKKVDTKQESFKMYREGRTIADIARERKLSPQTVEGHLCHFILLGELAIDDLVSEEKISRIRPLLSPGPASLTPVKEKLGNDISYGEIRMVQAWVNSLHKSSAHENH